MTTRRVVTGTNAEGKSYYVHDGPNPGRLEMGLFVGDEIWIDDPANPDPTAAKDPATSQVFRLEPPPGGSVVRIFTFQPEGRDVPELAQVLSDNAARFDTGGVMEEDSPGMHTTRTIDYGIVLSGEIDLELDEGEVHLGPGDVVVQRATRHAWHNRGSEPCTMVFVLISSPNYS